MLPCTALHCPRILQGFMGAALRCAGMCCLPCSATATATATAGRGAATTTATTSMPAHGAQVPPASSAASNAGAAAPDAEGGGGGGAEGGGSHSARRTHWTERVTAPLRFGARELLPLAARVGGAAAVTKVRQRRMHACAHKAGTDACSMQAVTQCTQAPGRTQRTG